MLGAESHAMTERVKTTPDAPKKNKALDLNFIWVARTVLKDSTISFLRIPDSDKVTAKTRTQYQLKKPDPTAWSKLASSDPTTISTPQRRDAERKLSRQSLEASDHPRR